MRFVVDTSISKNKWRQIAKEFADNSIYQTWEYQQVRTEEDGHEFNRFVLKDPGGDIICMGIVRIKTIRPIGFRIGYIQNGPLLMKADDDKICPMEALKALRNYYVGPIVSILRAIPHIPNDSMGEEIINEFKLAGFSHNNTEPYQTFLVSLHEDEDEILSRINRKGRSSIRKAKKKLNIVIEDNERAFEVLDSLYTQAKERKRFKGIDAHTFYETQKMLDEEDKIVVFLAYYEGVPIAAMATAHFGKTALGIISASTEKGLKLGASYLLYWEAYLYAKKRGLHYWDMGGFDKTNNPGVYLYKQRMGGTEVKSIGSFDAYSNIATHFFIKFIELFVNKLKR